MDTVEEEVVDTIAIQLNKFGLAEWDNLSKEGQIRLNYITQLFSALSESLQRSINNGDNPYLNAKVKQILKGGKNEN